jgi:AmiR/NasT family two-component response regulator
MTLTKLRILICDDNRAHRRMLKQLLIDMGVKEVGESPVEFGASSPLSLFKPDMVVGRLAQTERGILDLIAWLRDPATSTVPGVPVLLSVGTASRELLTLAVKTGADLLVVEPVTIGALEKRIASLIASPPRRIRTRNYFGPDRRRTLQTVYQGSERRHAADSTAA